MDDKLKMSKTSVDKPDEMDMDDDPCSEEDVENGATLLDEDDDDDDDDDDEDDDDNEDMDDDPDYQEEEDDSRVSTGAASISVDETSSNPTAMDIPTKADEGHFEETPSGSPARSTATTSYENPSLQMKKFNLKIKRWKREDTEGKSPSVSRPEDLGTPTPSSADPTVDDRCLLYQEKWPGKICAFCNLGERSQLGQGPFLRLEWENDFKTTLEDFTKQLASKQLTPMPLQSPTAEMAPIIQYRRQKSAAKFKQQFSTSSFEPVDELSVIGHLDVPDLNTLFEHSESSGGYVYVHHFCATWTQGVKCDTADSLENVPELILESLMRRCSYCGHLGASAPCTYTNCLKFFHYPCIFASASFQEMSVPALICSSHLDHVPLMELSANVACGICSTLGDVTNLMMCTVCGNHFHGVCIGLALLPGVRAGWQCGNCRTCQVCRQPAEQTKVMLCEGCDKAYHPGCLRPQVTTIPKIGWKCKCCRICTDCGSRTPGAGLSSRWHAHYTVCDSCYQQRNKGSSCPLCHRAYRAAAHREMVQCIDCRKYIHGACDPEAEYITSHSKSSASDYRCPICKNAGQRRRDGFDEFGDSNSSMDVFQLPDDHDSEYKCNKDFEDGRMGGFGLGKGKPYAASKIAKKRLLHSAHAGRSKGLGKLNAALKPMYQKKGQRLVDFPRKRPRGRMRGIFGVPGLGLQRPLSDMSSKNSSNEIDFNNENRIVLCSAKDKFVLGQDICVMCGSLGTDQEACLISCSQCGQCYHPFCVNVKITKVILQKGWRCLDCTICEGCGQRNDESRLILCDECDISYHIYCTDPKLDYVPRGTWKCKWCAQCLTCGSNDPGFNCTWLNNYTECGPCASRSVCPSCQETYTESQLIIKCYQCDRWLHGKCDKIENEEEAEKCAEESYTCLLCRPRGTAPPHLYRISSPKTKQKASSRDNSPDGSRGTVNEHFMDGVYLSESGIQHMKCLTSGIEICHQRKKRKDWRKAQSDKEAAIMAAIESVVCSSRDTINDSMDQADDAYKMDFDDMKEEPSEPEPIYKEGMVIQPREDGRPPEPPEGFSILTLDSGVMVLRRKRVRNLQKLGIGGFVVRGRMPRSKDKDEENTQDGDEENKPRRKPNRWKKPKSKIAENYPNYIQDAFFGRDLLDACSVAAQILDSSESEEVENNEEDKKTIELSQAELKVMEDVKAKQKSKQEVTKKCLEIKEERVEQNELPKVVEKKNEIITSSDQDTLKDILLSDNLLDSIMNEQNNSIKTEMEDAGLVGQASHLNEESSSAQKDEFNEILGSHFNLDSMVRETGLPNMDSKDVEEIFKVVLTDDASQESQDPSNSNMLLMGNNNMSALSQPQNGVGLVQNQNQNHAPIMSPSRSGLPVGMSRGKVPAPALPPVVTNIPSSPIYTPGMSPYHSEYSNSPSQFSPAFSEPHSPWVQNSGGEDSLEGVGSQSSALNNNQRNSQKMEADEALGPKASISAVLYANLTHPEWKKEFPAWPERSRQILKKWRTLTPEQKAPFLLKARENRTNLRHKKAQQTVKDDSASSDNRTSSTSSATQSPTINSGEDQDKMLSQQRSREAENERQWKHLQAMRQQQAQAAQQQQVVQDQRGQVYQRLPVQQRNLSIDTNQFANSDQQVLVHSSHLATQLQVSTNQDGSLTPLQSPGSASSQQSRSPYPSPVLKVTRVVSPASASPSPQYTRAQSAQGATDLFSPPISTPSVGQQKRNIHFNPTSPRGREDQANQEMTRHLRELLQRQQFKKDSPADQRMWNSEESQNQDINTQNVQSQQQLNQQQQHFSGTDNIDSRNEDMPDNVTDELEKLQEGDSHNIGEVDGVLGDLDDDDELLAEMGADFNILEYADPELDNLDCGNKTNILYDLVDDE